MAVINLGLQPITAADSITAAGNVLRLVNDLANPGASQFYGTDGSGIRGWFALASAGVVSITGTAGQVLANGGTSAQTGAVTLTLATALVSINSVTASAATNLALIGGSSGATLTLGQGASGAATFNRSINLTAFANTVVTGQAYGQIVQSSTGGSGIFPYNIVGNLVLSGRDNASTGVVFLSGSGLTNTAQFAGSGNFIVGSESDSGARLQSIGSSSAPLGGIQGIISAQSSGGPSAETIQMGVVDGSYVWIQGIKPGTAYRTLTLSQAGGNVLIGGTTDISGSGGLKVFGSTSATSTTSGAFQVVGGVGIGGAIFAGSSITVPDASALIFGSGVQTYIQGNGTTNLLNFYTGNTVRCQISNTALTVNPSTASTSSTTGALVVTGGVGIGGAFTVATTFQISSGVITWGQNYSSGTARGRLSWDTGKVVIDSYGTMDINTDGNNTRARFTSTGLTVITSTVSTSTTTGAIVVTGGVGIGGDMFVGGDLTVSGGNVGIGGAIDPAYGLYVKPSTLSGATQIGIASEGVLTSSATSGYAGYFSLRTAATSFTLGDGRGISISSPVVGAGSSITTNRGLNIDNQGASGVTNAYGIDIAAQSGAATVNIGLRNLGATVLATPASAVSLATNSTLTLELTSNTVLSFKVRGTDGTTRTGTVALS